MSSDVENLKAARELIARPGGWTQGYYARRSSGAECSYLDEKACSFCAAGAMRKAGASPLGHPKVWRLLRTAMGNHITDWNDFSGRTQADVIAAFDRAIAFAEAEAANAPA